MTTGVLVRITGARNFTGRVLIATDIAMIVAVGEDRTVTLRRDPASTKPDQWRFGGLPVGVRPVAQPSGDFANRLAALEQRTRRDEEA
jgi:hypothetical protein